MISCSHGQITCIMACGQGLNVPLVATVSGQAGTPYPIYFPSPDVTHVSPGTGITAGGTTNVLTGSNFGTNATVTLGGAVCPVISCAHTQLVILAASGQGLGIPLTVTVSGQDDYSGTTFEYDPPSILSLDATAGPDSGGTPLRIDGRNFGTNGTVTLAGMTCPVVSWSHTAIRCKTPATEATNAPVVVTVSGQSAVSESDFRLYMAVALSLTNNGPDRILAWPLKAAGWVLEQAGTLGTNPAAWSPPPTTLVTNGDEVNATVTVTNDGGFFRLREP